jgi:DNA (cytosine-5)-methyltransferase 1
LVASDANRLGVYHNQRVRRLTPREAARLQGFPDSFILHPNDDKAYHKLGNSVSINVVKAVAQEVILKTLYSTQERIDKSELPLCQVYVSAKVTSS